MQTSIKNYGGMRLQTNNNEQFYHEETSNFRSASNSTKTGWENSSPRKLDYLYSNNESSSSLREARKEQIVRKSRLTLLAISIIGALLIIAWEIVDFFDLVESGANVLLLDPNLLWFFSISIGLTLFFLLWNLVVEIRARTRSQQQLQYDTFCGGSLGFLAFRYGSWILVCITECVVFGLLLFKLVLTVFACLSAAIFTSNNDSSTDSKTEVEESCAVLLSLILVLTVCWAPIVWKTILEAHNLRPSNQLYQPLLISH